MKDFKIIQMIPSGGGIEAIFDNNHTDPEPVVMWALVEYEFRGKTKQSIEGVCMIRGKMSVAPSLPTFSKYFWKVF